LRRARAAATAGNTSDGDSAAWPRKRDRLDTSGDGATAAHGAVPLELSRTVRPLPATARAFLAMAHETPALVCVDAELAANSMQFINRSAAHRLFFL
jgi:hypothetical protein